ncbi:MAG TPA: HEPN domain-containing protein [Sedimentisphaerales bacterium]|nr:HEPN domain-containing protein [Sedimentisphaerales bacterium]
MPESDLVLLVVREWVQKAENDLRTSAHTLKLVDDCPTEAVCFHAQQCVEKYLKALLISSGLDFPRTHDIGELIALIPLTIRLKGLTVESQRRLTTYATLARYPGHYDPITVREARSAVRLARATRSQIRKFLPAEAIRKKLRR